MEGKERIKSGRTVPRTISFEPEVYRELYDVYKRYVQRCIVKKMKIPSFSKFVNIILKYVVNNKILLSYILVESEEERKDR